MEPGSNSTESERHESALPVTNETLEQRIAERTAALRESEEWLRLLVEGTRDCALFILDPKGHITTWNEGARRLKGYESNEVVGRHFSLFYTPEDMAAGKPARELEAAEREGKYEEEGERVRKDGSRFRASVLITALRDEQGRLRGFSKVTRDITDRERANEALRESEERLRLVLQASSMGTFEVNLVSGSGWWNAMEFELLGLKPGDAPPCPETFFRFVHPEDVELVRSQWEEALRVGKLDAEFRIVRADGEVRWLAGRGQFVLEGEARREAPDARGQGLCFLGVNFDVTARKQAQAALRESEERLRLAHQAAKIGAFEWNVQTGVNVWTPELETMYGLARGEFGNTQPAWEQLIHPEDRAAAVGWVNQAFETGEPVEAEWRIIWRDGSVHWIAGRFQAFKDAAGKPLHLIGVNIDMTERKRAEELLARSRDRFNGIISAAMDAIISIDSQQRIVLFNPAAEKMFGVPAREAVGESINRFIPTRFRVGHLGHVENFGKTGVSTRQMGGLGAVSGLRANGEEFPVEASISQVEVSGERLFTVILRDITVRQRAEEEARASREQLRALAARIQAVREEERTHAAREIHDVLAQELTGLKMDLAWLRNRLAEPFDTSKQRILQEKVGALMELTDKASQSVQRIATELRPVVLDSLGLCAATEWVAADFQKRTEICCKAIVPSQDLAMDWDRSTALFRILQESLTNVARHAQATKVEIRLWREADEIILTIHDNGRGVQPNELNDPHSIGLLGMRERALLLEGRCVIKSQAERGTTVEVRIPMASIANPDKKL